MDTTQVGIEGLITKKIVGQIPWSIMACPICRSTEIDMLDNQFIRRSEIGAYIVISLGCEFGHIWNINLVKSAGYTVLTGEYEIPKVDYKEYISSPEWKERAKELKEKIGYKCQLCGSVGDDHSLHVHHNNYKNPGHEEDNDLVVLCANCHAKFHDKLPA